MKRKKWVSEFNKKVKIKKILMSIVYVIALILVLYNILFLIYSTITHKDYMEILGYSFFCQENSLMENEIKINDLVITKSLKNKINSKKPKENLKENDIIAYRVNGNIRINKILSKMNDEKTGKEKIITKSNKNFHPDKEEIVEEQVIGKVILTIPFLGIIAKIMQTKIASVIVIILLGIKLNYNMYINSKKLERTRKKKRKERTEKHL